VNTISQSVLSTNYVQVPITIQSPDAYDPSGDVVQFAFTEFSYPVIEPVTWYTDQCSWATFPGPAYWAQCLVGPANGGVSLAIGTYTGWVKITDSSAVPVSQTFLLKITR
jgi:hypothetical protein